MFLIAGVQPKTRRIDAQPHPCPSCGLARAYTTRIDHYLSLFFIPLIRVKQGESFLLCDACSRSTEEKPRAAQSQRQEEITGRSATLCVACKRTFDASYRYCPHCGQRA